MDNIMILTAKHYSHIIPLESLINKINSDYNIICLGFKNNKEILNHLNVNFIEYKDEVNDYDVLNLSKKYINESNKMLEMGMYEKAHELMLKSGIVSNYNIDKNKLNNIYNQIKKWKPKWVLCDAADVYANIISGDPNIKTISYMTNNIYNWTYFEYDKRNLLSIFFNLIFIDQYFKDSYFDNIYDKIKKLYSDVETELNTTVKISPFHNFNPIDNKIIVFSNEFFQNKNSLKDGKDYYFIPPLKNRFKKEHDIDLDLKYFISKSNKIAYISTGSFLSIDYDVYILYIRVLLNHKYKIIISSKDNCPSLRKFVKDNNLIEDVRIFDYAPQKYILSNSDLFITSGGFNSITESIYYGVPMIVSPLTAEQRLNGYEIEEKKLGYTFCKKRDKYITLDEMIISLETSVEHKNAINFYSTIIKREALH